MSEKALSVNAFIDTLRSQVQQIAEEHQWKMDDATKRGWAFQLWVAKLLCLEDEGYETEPEDSLLLSRDLQVDVCLEDPSRQHLLLAQCKYLGLSKPANVDEAEVIAFFARHDSVSDRQWVQKHGSADAILALADYGEKLGAGYSARYVFASTGKASARVKTLSSIQEQAYASKGAPVTCQLYDLYGLKDLYVRAHSVEEQIPHQVRIKLAGARYLRKATPYDTAAAVVSGNELRDLYARHHESLFAWNIRGYLGSRGINERIKETASTAPEKFYYYNNGVSAVCTGFDINGNELVAENFQIINGAQTIGALCQAGANSDVEVLLRVTRTGSVKTEKGFHRDMIEYNNSQNVIKVSDFRSNDPIQKWLEQQFRVLKPSGPIPEIHYIRKRRVGRKGLGQGIRLEELAKIRFAFLFEPTLIHSSPKLLWTEAEDGGAYDRAFGINGELVNLWPDEAFAEMLAALAIYFAIVKETRDLARRDSSDRYLQRLRFHCLALAGRTWRSLSDAQKTKATASSQGFESFWASLWDRLLDSVADTYEDAADRMTMFAFVRSDDMYQKMIRKFERKSRQKAQPRS